MQELSCPTLALLELIEADLDSSPFQGERAIARSGPGCGSGMASACQPQAVLRIMRENHLLFPPFEAGAAAPLYMMARL